MLDEDSFAAEETQEQAGGDLSGSSPGCLPDCLEDLLIITKSPITTSTVGSARQKYRDPQLISSIYNPFMKVERQERASEPKQNMKRSRVPSKLVPDHGGTRLKLNPLPAVTFSEVLDSRNGISLRRGFGSQSLPQMGDHLSGYTFQPLPVESNPYSLIWLPDDTTPWPGSAPFVYMNTPDNPTFDQEFSLDAFHCNNNVPNSNTRNIRQAGEGIIPTPSAHSLPTPSPGMYSSGKAKIDMYNNWA